MVKADVSIRLLLKGERFKGAIVGAGFRAGDLEQDFHDFHDFHDFQDFEQEQDLQDFQD